MADMCHRFAVFPDCGVFSSFNCCRIKKIINTHSRSLQVTVNVNVWGISVFVVDAALLLLHLLQRLRLLQGLHEGKAASQSHSQPVRLPANLSSRVSSQPAQGA